MTVTVTVVCCRHMDLELSGGNMDYPLDVFRARASALLQNLCLRRTRSCQVWCIRTTRWSLCSGEHHASQYWHWFVLWQPFSCHYSATNLVYWYYIHCWHNPLQPATKVYGIASLAIILCCDVATTTEKAQENSWQRRYNTGT